MEINLRFGMHQDVELIHDEIARIDGLVIPAHILAYQPAATSIFVSSLNECRYFIDPMTFLLQSRKSTHKSDANEIRPSVRKMVEAYDEGLLRQLEELEPHQSLTDSSFNDIDSLCQGVIDFQTKMVETHYGSSKASKYLRRYKNTEVTQPRFVVPPYFQASEHGNDWYNLSLACAKKCNQLMDNKAVPIILMPVSCLDAETIESVVSDYRAFERVVIWLDNFNQIALTEEDIRKARDLIGAFSTASVAIEALYGGYLLMLTEFDGNEAISHGIFYTQHKSADTSPGGGGVPDRYYIPRFHEFRSLSQTDLILHKHSELMCNCEICSEHLAGNPDNILKYKDNPELLKRHFLAVRQLEVKALKEKQCQELLDELSATYEKYHESIKVLRNPDAVLSGGAMQGLDYLENWKLGLSLK